MAFYVYMLHCADGSYYIGQKTNDLEHRVSEHEAGLGGIYTHTRRPVMLVWQSGFPTRDEAIAAERQIKGWSRAKKEALIRSDWTTISHLARSSGFDRLSTNG